MRKNGVMLHITSLPGPYGVGTMSHFARQFVEQLQRNQQSIWQILPLNPTGFGDSPYASMSTFAGNPYLIDLDQLAFDGLLQWDEFQHEQWCTDPAKVDFGVLAVKRMPILFKAAKRFLEHPAEDYEAFKKENQDWLDDYALFMAIKNSQEKKAWKDWPEEYRVYDPKKVPVWNKEFEHEAELYKVIQYLFFCQWHALKKYANDRNIEILGDIPIYVAMDSADAWSRPHLFVMDEESNPTLVAAVPPDAFSEDGQLWGNPVYDWKNHKEEDYAWWISRMKRMSDLYDIVRIDHFRGFESFYAVKADAKNAKDGKWMKGPGSDLFKAITKKLGKLNIVAEDLGIITPEVHKMLEEVGYPGMRVMEFGLRANTIDGQNHLPLSYPEHCIAYVGTHDNDTLYGWFNSLSAADQEYVREYLDTWDPENINWRMFTMLLGSAAETTIVQVQDLLKLGSEARMNRPGEMGTSWQWRLLSDQLDEDTMSHLKYLTGVYRRRPDQQIVPKDPKEKKDPKSAEKKD